jgi:hypothetical protein
VELAINNLEALRVRSFIPGPTSSAAGAALRITIEGNSQSETLFLQGEAPGGAGKGATLYYAQLEDLSKAGGRSILFTVEVPDVLMQTLVTAADALRDPRILDFDPSAVTAVGLHAPRSADVVLQRLDTGTSGSGWQMVVAADGGGMAHPIPADAAAVQHLLAELAALTKLDIKSDSPTDADRENWGLTQPERRITLTLGSTSLALDIGRAGSRDPVVYGQVANALSVYTLSAEVLRDTPVSPGDWRDRHLLSLPGTAKLTAAVLVDLETSQPVWAWGSAAGPRVPADREATLAALGAAVRDLRAVRFESGTFNPASSGQGPWRYRLDATFALPGGGGGDTASVHSILLTARMGGTEQWGGAQEFGAVFRLAQPLIDALWRLTYGDRDPGLPEKAAGR